MCQFLSALVLRNGDVLSHPMLDSHADLVTYFALPDTAAHHQHFAKVELTPHADDWLTPATWAWRLDEDTAPGWWEDVAVQAEATLRARAEKMIITGAKSLIVDGCWIIGGQALVSEVRAGRIVRVQDSATVQNVRGSATVQNVRGSATVQNVRSSATVRDVSGSATVRDVWGSATVRDVSGSATVQNVGGSATVRDVRGSATVRDVRGSATVRDVWDSATLDASAKQRLVSKP